MAKTPYVAVTKETPQETGTVVGKSESMANINNFANNQEQTTFTYNVEIKGGERYLEASRDPNIPTV